jgi:hypothetical protein
MITGSRSRLPVLAFVSLVLATVSCGEGGATRAGGSPATAPPVRSGAAPAAETLWIAGIAFADDPNELDPLTQRLLGSVGTATIVGPTSCYEGIPESVIEGSYLAAVAAGSEDELAEVVDASGQEALFEAEVGVVCG